MTKHWRPTHTVNGVPVMRCDADQWNEQDVPEEPWLAGSIGIYTLEEWTSEAWPAIRMLADGSWADLDHDQAHDVTHRVEEVQS